MLGFRKHEWVSRDRVSQFSYWQRVVDLSNRSGKSENGCTTGFKLGVRPSINRDICDTTWVGKFNIEVGMVGEVVNPRSIPGWFLEKGDLLDNAGELHDELLKNSPL
jgi:hypothetical protein